MSGAAKVLDPLGVTGARAVAKEVEGHQERKAKRAQADQERVQAEEHARAKAAAAADAAAALEKSHQSQREALKRKGRRASILTSSQGVVDPLGVPG